MSNILSKSFLSDLPYKAFLNGLHLRFSGSIAIENVGIVLPIWYRVTTTAIPCHHIPLPMVRIRLRGIINTPSVDY